MSVGKLLIRLFCGVDMSAGILLYVSLSLCFGQEFSLIYLLTAIFCSQLPDSDMVPYLLLRNFIKQDGSNKSTGHWPYGHHPVVVVPITAVAGWLLAPAGAEYYVATLCGCCTLAHFIHDSVKPQGMHWLSPFTWSHFTLRSGFPRRVSEKEISDYFEGTAKRSIEEDSSSYEINSRMPSLATGEWVLIGVALLSLSLFAF